MPPKNWQYLMNEDNFFIKHLAIKKYKLEKPKKKGKSQSIPPKLVCTNKDLIATFVVERPIYEGAEVSYGISIVSKKDQPNKETGRLIAYKRFQLAKSKHKKRLDHSAKDNRLAKLLNINIPLYSCTSFTNIVNIFKTFREKNETIG